MADKPWKKFERAVGDMMGLPKGKQREGPTGAGGLDVVSRPLSMGVQCKYRKKLPPLLVEALKNAEMHAGFNQRGVAVFTEKGWSRHHYIVALRFEDLLQLIQDAGEARSECPGLEVGPDGMDVCRCGNH